MAAVSTSGPDLTGVAVETTGDLGTQTVVEYTFHSDVAQVTFGADNEDDIADAVTATVNDLAVTDEDGDANPEGAGDALGRPELAHPHPRRVSDAAPVDPMSRGEQSAWKWCAEAARMAPPRGTRPPERC